MTTDPAQKLRELALCVTRGELRRPWSVQTSNSFRRIGTDRGDGNVLCAVTQPTDGQPDLHAAPHVLDYIIAAHPFAILQLIQERDHARHALAFLRHKIPGHDQIFQEAQRIAMEEKIPTDRAAAGVRALIADLTDRNGLRQAWEEIEDGVRREIIESWEEILRDQAGAGPEAPSLEKAGDSTGDAARN